jgi:two-component system phosphate regulon sensor histidine kinase PhoR
VPVGIRAKLFFTYFLFIVVGIGITGLVLSHYLKENIIERTEDELTSFVKAVQLVIDKDGGVFDAAQGDRIADLTGAALAARVTIIREDGIVIGDSDLTPRQIRNVENHKARPEIQDALRLGWGTASRWSHTLSSDMLYVAARDEIHGRVLIIRVAKSLKSVSAALSALRSILLFACVVGLFAAALMSGISSHLLFRRLRNLVSSAKSLVKGETRARINDAGQDELSGLAGSINEMSDKLEEYVTQLAERRDQFEAVLEGMSEAVAALDKDGKVTMINRAGAVLLGITDHPVGKALLETGGLSALNKSILSGEIGKDTTLEFDLEGDMKRRILARAAKLANGGAVIVLLDVTELRKLEHLRRDFVSNVSHELRTPVSIIKANAETLRDGALEDKEAAHRFLDAMINNANRLSNLIADLLDISRIEEGKFKLQIEAVPVEAALHRAASSLEIKAEEQGITIEVDPCPSLFAEADAHALDQMLFNLVDNAVKYAGRGGRIDLRAWTMGDRARIEVEDRGPGIEPQYRERLFERFFRIDKGRSREMGGTGLGLAIVKHLALAMQGEVGMSPAHPNGSIFWILLPKPNDRLA